MKSYSYTMLIIKIWNTFFSFNAMILQSTYQTLLTIHTFEIALSQPDLIQPTVSHSERKPVPSYGTVTLN